MVGGKKGEGAKRDPTTETKEKKNTLEPPFHKKKTQKNLPPQYVAPEVIAGIPGLEYGPKVDAWSAGVVLFVMLGGYPPFWAESEPALFGLVRRGHFTFDDPVWGGVSEG